MTYEIPPPKDVVLRNGHYVPVGCAVELEPTGQITIYWDEVKKWAATDHREAAKQLDGLSTVIACRALLVAVQREREAAAAICDNEAAARQARLAKSLKWWRKGARPEYWRGSVDGAVFCAALIRRWPT